MNSRPMISRPRYLHILHTAVAVRQYRFARLAALDWLAAYPGDLTAGLYYAHALAGENRPAQAASVLEGLLRADPEFVEALDALAAVQENSAAAADAGVPTHLFALTGRSRNRRTLSTWGGSLWLSRQALLQGKPDLAEEMLRDALRQAPNEPLVQIVHLDLLRRGPALDPQVGREIALRYSHTSPDCLACMLHLAAWSLEAGAEDEAVALLHQVAARDVGGQVAVRMWGQNHPYRVLWPERMQIDLRLSIPAEVSAAMGWNRLPSGLGSPPAAGPAPARAGSGNLPDLQTNHEPQPARAGSGNLPDLQTNHEPQPIRAGSGNLPDLQPPADLEDTRPTRVRRADPELVSPGPKSAPPTTELYWALATEDAGSAPDLWNPSVPTAAVAKDRLTSLVGEERKPRRSSRKNLDPELRSVSQEMDSLAQRLKLPVHGHLDGRFPVYVIFSHRRRLEEHYGAGVAALLESEIGALAAAVGKRRGWTSLLLLADDPAGLSPLGLSPVRSGDPWELKLLLADLDEALRRRGQCIGALLIVGGPEIIPFHCLPNPVDDPDVEVFSDNPYATPNENYFIPEWPVGRLPGGGRDARLLLDCLNRIRLSHEIAVTPPGRMQRLLEWLRSRFARQPHARAAFGYSAAVWKEASRQVFRSIGRPNALHISPPRGYDGSDPETVARAAAHPEHLPPLAGRLGYFNLHGLADGPEWYGQRDPLDRQPGPDLPVALTPQDVLGAAGKSLPRIVFSQACYGLSTQPCETEQSMALSFLHGGSLAVVGSTSMSYGAVTTPLAAGDLLALNFWREVQRGVSAGEALRQAKLRLLAERDATQGYLDGEEQKTLISFALYGDPLATPQTAERLPKSLRYQDSPLLEVPTICDRALSPDAAIPLPPEVVASVRSVVSHYLPGMSDASVSFARQRETCDGQGHVCPTSTLEHEALPAQPAGEKLAAASAGGGQRSTARAVRQKVKHHLHSKNGSGAALKCSTVTLSNCVELGGGCHPQVARLTLDEKGKLVKLVVSR